MKLAAKGKARKVILSGGPWDGFFHHMRGDSMVFRVGEYKGRYVATNTNIARWEAVK